MIQLQVEFIPLISENLRTELHCEMYGPTLRYHPHLSKRLVRFDTFESFLLACTTLSLQ